MAKNDYFEIMHLKAGRAECFTGKCSYLFQCHSKQKISSITSNVQYDGRQNVQIDNNGGFPLDHSTQILRISNVSYVHLIKSKASGHIIILQQDVDTYLKPS